MEQSHTASGTRSTEEFTNSSAEKNQSSAQNKDNLGFTSPRSAPQPSAAAVPAQSDAKATHSTQGNASLTGDNSLKPSRDAKTHVSIVKPGNTGKDNQTAAKSNTRASAVPPPNAISNPNLHGIGGGVCHNHSDFTSQREAGANVPLVLTAPKPKPNASHDDNIASLLPFFKFCDVAMALAQTMTEDGKEDVAAAHQFLLNRRDELVRQDTQEQFGANRNVEQLEDEEIIRADGELNAIIAAQPEAISLTLKMIDVHRRIRNGHNSDMMRSAANLLAHREVKSCTEFKSGHVSTLQKQKIAIGVIHDCRTCELERMRSALTKRQSEERHKAELQAKEKEAKRKEAEKTRAAALAAEDELRRQKEIERQRRAITPPLADLDNTPVFNKNDSKFAKKRKASLCWNCGLGDLSGEPHFDKEREYVYICDLCKHTYHLPCTMWDKCIKSTALHTPPDSENWKFICLPCTRSLSSAWRRCTAAERGKGKLQDTHPTDGADEIDSPANQTPQQRPSAQASGGDRPSPTIGQPSATPLGIAASPSFVASTLQRATPTIGGTTLFTGDQSTLTVKIDPYVLWKGTLPLGWDLRKEHPEFGFGKPAYLNWKTINIPRRDQAGGRLGSLANSAISPSILGSIASCLLRLPAFRDTKTDAEIHACVRDDPGSLWIKGIPDHELIHYLDTHFNVVDADAFLSLRFPGPDGPEGYASLTEDGDTNYFAVALGAFADQWLEKLSELRKGGWDETAVNLRQAFINAVELQPTLFREATTYATTSHDILISHMRTWCYRKESEIEKHARARRATQAKGASAGGIVKTAPKSPSNDKRPADVSQQIKILRTELNALKNPDRPVTARIPSHINSKTQWWCHGCGKTYSRGPRAIPCEPACVYEDHAEHNAGYRKGIPYPAGKYPLSWGPSAEAYRQKYGKEMPPSGKKFLELKLRRQQTTQKEPRKRERESEPDAPQ
jgi:hypothetical protein